jgi:hypothetical protein
MKKVGLPPKKWMPNFERSSRKPNPRGQKELEGEELAKKTKKRSAAAAPEKADAKESSAKKSKK